MEINDRLDNIEFRMDLLRDGSPFSQYLYDCKITQKQLDALYDLMDELQEKVDKGMEISSASYETKALRIVDNRTLDYHFCELFARLLWEDERYVEVFPALYGHLPKFKHLFKK